MKLVQSKIDSQQSFTANWSKMRKLTAKRYAKEFAKTNKPNTSLVNNRYFNLGGIVGSLLLPVTDMVQNNIDSLGRLGLDMFFTMGSISYFTAAQAVTKTALGLSKTLAKNLKEKGFNDAEIIPIMKNYISKNGTFAISHVYAITHNKKITKIVKDA